MKSWEMNCANPCWSGSSASRNFQFTRWRASPGTLVRGSITRDGTRISSEDYIVETKRAFSGMIHSALRFEGKAGRLSGNLLHYTIRTFAEHEAKVERYTTVMAQELFSQGKRSWSAAMWLAAPWSWFQNYVLHLGFLDGYRGWLISRMAARGTWLKFKKLGKLVEAERRGRGARTP